MSALSDLQDQLAALRAARASGLREIEVRHGDTMSRKAYRSDAEMAAAIADLQSQINGLAGTKTIRQYQINNDKGL